MALSLRLFYLMFCLLLLLVFASGCASTPATKVRHDEPTTSPRPAPLTQSSPSPVHQPAQRRIVRVQGTCQINANLHPSLLGQRTPQCPQFSSAEKGRADRHRNWLYKLNRMYPPAGIFIGLQPDRPHREFVRKIIDIVGSYPQPIPVTLLVDNSLLDIAYSEFGLDRESFVQIINTGTEDATWAQDYFENAYDISSWQSNIIDIPYSGTDTEWSSYAIGSYCRMPILRHNAPIDDETDNAGDYGGNIEALPDGSVVIGNNMRPGFRRHLQKSFAQKVRKIKLQWLTPGHVDEIISVLPLTNRSGCQYVLAYASPAKAIELLNNSSAQKIGSLYRSIQPDKLGPDDRHIYRRNMRNTDCLRHWKTKAKNKYCRGFRRYNANLGKRIEREVRAIETELNKHQGCKMVVSMPFPQFFTYASEQEGPAAEELYVAMTENLINNVSLGEHLILPEHSVPVFGDYVKKTLRPFGFKLHYADVNFLHNSFGGYHCNTNIIRACRSKN